MADIVITIPTIYDYLAQLLTGISFWAAVAVFAIMTIAFSRWYRRKRGWY